MGFVSHLCLVEPDVLHVPTSEWLKQFPRFLCSCLSSPLEVLLLSCVLMLVGQCVSSLSCSMATALHFLNGDNCFEAQQLPIVVHKT